MEEAEKLKLQIQYLTDLISSAKHSATKPQLSNYRCGSNHVADKGPRWKTWKKAETFHFPSHQHQHSGAYHMSSSGPRPPDQSMKSVVSVPQLSSTHLSANIHRGPQSKFSKSPNSKFSWTKLNRSEHAVKSVMPVKMGPTSESVASTSSFQQRAPFKSTAPSTDVNKSSQLKIDVKGKIPCGKTDQMKPTKTNDLQSKVVLDLMKSSSSKEQKSKGQENRVTVVNLKTSSESCSSSSCFPEKQQDLNKSATTANTGAMSAVIGNSLKNTGRESVSGEKKCEGDISTVKGFSTVVKSSSGDPVMPQSPNKEKKLKDLEAELSKTQSKISCLRKQVLDQNHAMKALSPIKTPYRQAIQNDLIINKGRSLGISAKGDMMTKGLQDYTDSSPYTFVKYQEKKPQTLKTLYRPTAEISAGKFVKTKYSLKRLRNSSPKNKCAVIPVKKPSEKRMNDSRASSKLVTKTVVNSRYKLKKIVVGSRKTPTAAKPKSITVLKTRFKLKKVRSNSDSTSHSCPSHTQNTAHVIKSKYKLNRVVTQSAKPKAKWVYTNCPRPIRPSMRRAGTEVYGGTHWSVQHLLSKRWPTQNPLQLPHLHHWQSRHKWNMFSTNQGIQRRGQPEQFWKSQMHWNKDSFAVRKDVLLRRLKHLKKDVPFDPKLKLDRRKKKEKPKNSETGVSFVIINGMLYKSSRKSLVKAGHRQTDIQTPAKRWPVIVKSVNSRSMKTVTVRGVKFRMDASGKCLHRIQSTGNDAGSNNNPEQHKMSMPVTRIDIGGVTYIQTKPGTLERVGSQKTRALASRAVQKSLVTASARYKKTNNHKKYCMFYNRFGKCNRRDTCPYLHDPDKIAVCTRFLRGTCKLKDCPFSHKVAKEKMPVCSFFLRGVCNSEDCPYLHVKVNRDAAICEDFVRGYCALGEKCKKKHTLECSDFARTGSCQRGKSCRLVHRKSRKRSSASKPDNDSAPGFQKKIKLAAETASTLTLVPCPPEVPDDLHLPFKDRTLPAYIALTTDHSPDDTAESSDTQYKPAPTGSLRIRPSFKVKKT